MRKSNVITNSNILLCKKEFPWWDSEFMVEIEDDILLKEYDRRRRNGDARVVAFSEKQNAIIKTELRCVYAKNDPCWGYDNKSKRVISKCINGDCRLLSQCNPDYTLEEELNWQPLEKETLLYKDPAKLRKYYFVDMISDEEMSSYIFSPKYEGYSYQVEKDPWQKINKYSKKTKIDPETGRKMVIVGYHWRITDNGNYESEEMFPIWDYVNEVEVEKKTIKLRKTKKIEKKLVVQETPFGVKQKDYVSIVKNHIVGEIKLIEFAADVNLEGNVVVLFQNPAELAFASNTLLAHGVQENIKLALFSQYDEYEVIENIIISNSVLEQTFSEESETIWKLLSSKSNIKVLKISKRDYRMFVYENQEVWTCGNMYGITHMAIDGKAFHIFDKNDSKLTYITIIREEDGYVIYDDRNVAIGVLDVEFQAKLQFLKELEEIPGLPIRIENLAIRIEDNKIEILGMGHLKFNEY